MDKFISNVDCQKWLNVYRLYGTGFKIKMAKMKPEKGKELKVLDSW